MAIDLILGADALRPPLTGIGRYAYELARQLRPHPDVERLRYFVSSHWVTDPIDALTAQPQTLAAASGSGGKPPMLARMRSSLADNRAAVWAYQAIMPTLSGWRLRGEAGAIYHSPNYLVPPFPGRTVNTVHDLSFALFPAFHPPSRVEFFKLGFEASLARTTHGITDTETVRQEFIQHFGWPADKVTAIGLGADAAFHPRSPEDLAPTLAQFGLGVRQYALCVGTIEPRKNVARLLQSYEQLPPALRRAYPLVLVGGKGWQSEDVHRYIERATQQGWLHYLSYADQAALPLLYAGARLLVYPSLYEGFGLPIVEAMASGTPVLTSNTSCMPEVAAGAAKLVNPLDVVDMAAGLEACLTDTQWLADATQKGLARAAMLSWKRCADETVAVYKSLR